MTVPSRRMANRSGVNCGRKHTGHSSRISRAESCSSKVTAWLESAADLERFSGDGETDLYFPPKPLPGNGYIIQAADGTIYVMVGMGADFRIIGLDGQTVIRSLRFPRPSSPSRMQKHSPGVRSGGWTTQKALGRGRS